MTDRELLELAAKAAGIPLARLEPETIWDTGHITRNGWNPLTDDGDALRLAVLLKISLVMTGNIVDAQCEDAMCSEAWDEHSDPYAATRRAITRAAAEVARRQR